MHRSVATFLDHTRWKLIFEQDYAGLSQHYIWLQIGTKFINSPDLQWSHPDKRPIGHAARHGTRQMLERLAGREIRSRNVDHLPLVQKNLHEYIVEFIPIHAAEYEEESKKSSYDLIKSIFTPKLVRDHLSTCTVSTCICAGVKVSESWTANDPSRPPLSSDADLAICHKMVIYLDDALTHLKSEHGIDATKPVSHGDLDVQILSNKPFQAEIRKLLRLALFLEMPGTSANEKRTTILKMLLRLLARPSGQDVLACISMGRLETIELLLTRLPKGKLILKSRYGVPSFGPDILEKQPGPLVPYRTLSAVGCRKKPDEETEQILDLFLSRGEDINEICWEYGTILNSAIWETYPHDLPGRDNPNWMDWLRNNVALKMVKLFMSRGADPNVRGPAGNALEFAWAVSNVRDGQIMEKRCLLLQEIICFLIDHGVVNEREDPNGMVPSTHRMRNILPDNEKERHYYKHGNKSASDVAAEALMQDLAKSILTTRGNAWLKAMSM